MSRRRVSFTSQVILAVLLAGLVVFLWSARHTWYDDYVLRPPGSDPTLENVRMLPVGTAPWHPRAIVAQKGSGLNPETCWVGVFFLSTCPACQRLAGAWKGVVHLGKREAEVAWIADLRDSGAMDFLTSASLPGDRGLSPAGLVEMRIFAVPQIWLFRGDSALRALPAEVEAAEVSVDQEASCG